MKSIFLDTNILLHFSNFDQINWLEEADCHNCDLVISPIVIDELDKKKVGNSKVANRARTILQRIESLAETESFEIQKNVHLQILDHKPAKSLYEQNDLNFDEPDHRLLASIIDYKLKNSSKTVLLCSDDIGPRLRSKRYEIGLVKLKEKYRLPSEDSELEKKIKKLVQENLSLKVRVPKPNLEFENGLDYIKFKIIDEFKLTRETFVLDELTKLKTQIEYLKVDEKNVLEKNPKTLAELSINLTALSNDQIRTYNKALDKYFKEFEKYLTLFFDFQRGKSLLFPIIINLSNEGNVPADDVDIHLHFPDGFRLVNANEVKQSPKRPTAPYRPKHRLDIGVLNSNIFNPYIPFTPLTSSFEINRPTIKRTNSYDVNMHRKSIKHSYKISLDTLVTIYDDFDYIKNYQIDYDITAANVPDKISGKLNVIFEK